MNAQLNTPKTWATAKDLAGQLGKYPGIFQTAVRTLIADHAENNRQLKPVSKYLICQTLRGQKFLSLLYFAAESVHPEKIEKEEQVNLGKLISMFEPFDIAALFVSFVLYRRARVFSSSCAEEFRKISPALVRESQAGAYIGEAIPAIGLGKGLLVGTLPHVCKGIFHKKDPDALKAYLLHLQKTKTSFDLNFETEKFGCSCLQLSSILLSFFGFGKQFISDYIGGLDPNFRLDDASAENMHPIKFSRLWIDCLLEEAAEQPIERMPGQYYPLEEPKAKLESQLMRVREEGLHWLERSESDISNESAPKLFSDIPEADSEIPEAMQDVFSLDEICAMEEEDFDDLIDTIDQHQEAKAGPTP